MSNKLFKFDVHNNLEFSEFALGVGAFYDLWHRDLSDTKEKAVKEMTFVYCIASMNPDNPFREYPSNERVKLASDLVFGKEVSYKNDKIMTKAILSLIEVEKSFARDFLRGVITNIGKLKNHLNAIDLNERDVNGKPIHNIKQYSDTLSKQTDLLKSMQEAIKAVDAEVASEEAKIRGDARGEVDI